VKVLASVKWISIALAAALAALLSVLLAGKVAAAPPAPDPLLPLAESSKGMAFTVRASSIHQHPLGYWALIRGRSERLRPLDSTDPRSPWFRSVESAWVVDCLHGTFSIVEDRFLGEQGEAVAVFTETAEAQERPDAGSVAQEVLTNLCLVIGHADAHGIGR
jgi:hypothetical protein